MTIERNIPTEKRFANDETSDGCTESNCPRCLTHPDHRGDIRHAGIGSYPEPDRVMWKGFQIAEDRSVPAHMILVRDSRGVSTITSAGHHPMTALRELAELRELVSIIADWKLPETGETWPPGGPVSYETMFGSLGVRDYMRNIATKALAILDAEGDGGAVGEANVAVGHTQTTIGGWAVATLSRHALNLPDKTPLYTRPARSGVVSDEAARDAARYRWLRDHSYGQQDHPICFEQTPREINGVRAGTLYVGPLFGDRLDQTIDAAIQGERHER